MNEAPLLSLCMIVKDEADCIGRCLESIIDAVDECIIVDTGSSDDTVQICRRYGARVITVEWNDSFSEARNHGLQMASGEWILWIDADEILEPNAGNRIRTLLKNTSYDVFYLRLFHFTGNIPDKRTGVFSSHPRLFRRSLNLRFHHNIHEALDIEEKIPVSECSQRTGTIPVTIYHYGYLNPVSDQKQKRKRNQELIRKELAEGRNVPWNCYHLAVEESLLGRQEEAFAQVNRSIVEFLLQGIIPPALVYRFKYAVLLNAKSWKGAWPAIEKAIGLYPDYVDLWAYMGIILYNLKNYPGAVKAFERCIQLGDEHPHYMITKGMGGYFSWYCKGLCYERMNQKQDALYCYERSLELMPSFPEAEKRRNSLLIDEPEQNPGESVPELVLDINM